MSGPTERGSQAPRIRTSIHSIREPVTESPEPLRNIGRSSLEFLTRRGAMPLSIRHKLRRLPKRFPVGTTFVVEGRTVAGEGKNSKDLRVFSRFVVLPGGRRIDLGGDAAAVTRGRRTRSRRRQNAASRASTGSKKIITG